MTTSTARTYDEPQHDLAMEGHLRAIALWSYLCSAFLALFIVLGSMHDLSRLPRASLSTAIPQNLGVIVGLVTLTVGFGILGYHLSRFSNWARRTVMVLGRICLLLTILVGLGSVYDVYMTSVEDNWGEPRAEDIAFTVVRVVAVLGWQIAILWVVDSERAVEICTPEYQSIGRETRAPHGFSSPLFWAPLMLNGALFAAFMTMRR